jgi:nucleotide-binding universal stress UspA family protein
MHAKEASMDYKAILVHLDRGERTRLRLNLALQLAESFDASVVGLFAVREAALRLYPPTEAASAVAEMIQRYRAHALQDAERWFSTVRLSGVRAEWRIASGDPSDAMVLSARYADLAIIGQQNRDADAEHGTPSGFVERVVLESGRPVLVVPHAGRFTAVGNRVLVAWDASRPASRAISGALPLLRRADTVQVVSFDPRRHGDHGDIAGADIALYLSRHGVSVSVAEQSGARVDVASQILSRAADHGVDLIVMGAYSHSRLREDVFGGVTHDILESMTVPVLMAH